jgi:hypothetical protein
MPSKYEPVVRKQALLPLTGKALVVLKAARAKLDLMTRIYSRHSLTWHGNALKLDRRELARIVADANWPNMWRVQLPDGQLTDMLNRTRAKDAAFGLALATLNRKSEVQETSAEASPARYFPPPLPMRPLTEITASSSAA